MLRLISLMKLKRMLRFRRVISLLKFKTAFKLWIRILLVVFTLFLFVHLAGSFWFMLASNNEEWIPPNYIGHDEIYLYSELIWTQYTTSLYYATLLFLGVDALPSKTGEVIYGCFVVYLGAVISAALFGQMTVLAQTLSSKSAKYNEALDKVNQAMLGIKAPKELQAQVTSYIMNTYWRRDEQEELQIFFDTLSPSLRLEVCTRLFKDTLMHNFVFGRSPECVDMLVRSLTAQLSKPEEVIVFYEDAGTDMYLLIQGEASVRCPTLQGDEAHIRFLYPSDFFGEISLLTGARRTATVVTANFCTLAVLPNEKLRGVVESFPALRIGLLSHGVDKYNEDWKIEVIKVLAQIPYFAGCSKSELTEIYYALKTERYEADSKLAERGESVDRFYIVATGKVGISALMRNDERKDILYLESGSAASVCSCLIEQKHQFFHRTVTDSCLLFLSAEAINSIFYSDFAASFPSLKLALANFHKSEGKSEFSECDFVLKQASISPFKLATLRLLRDSRKNRLKEANLLIEGLVSAIKAFISSRKSDNSTISTDPEEALEQLVVRMKEEMERLEAKVERLAKQTDPRNRDFGQRK